LLQHRFRILVVANDINLLATELAYNRLHSGTPGSDAGADRVDLRVVAVDRDLGPVTGLAGKALDRHGTVGNLCHFQFKETAHKTVGRTRENQLRSTVGAFNI